MGYTGIMEKEMGTAIVYWGQIGFRVYLEGQGDLISRLEAVTQVMFMRLENRGLSFRVPQLGILTFRCFFTGSG